MTFYNIENLDGLFHEIDNCEGGVMLRTGEGESVDLRHNDFVQTLLRTSSSKCGLEQLDVTIERASDTVNLLNYMIAGPRGHEAAHEELVVA